MNPSVKRSKSRNGCRGAWKCTPVPLLLSQRGPSLGPWHPFFPSPRQAQGRAETPEFKPSLESRVGFCFSKERGRRNWGFPGPFSRAVTPSQDSPFGLWMLNLLAHGRSIRSPLPHCSYEADMRPLTLPSPPPWGGRKAGQMFSNPPLLPSCSPLHVPAEATWTPEGAAALAHSPKSPSAKDSRLQGNRVLNARQPHPTDTRLEVIQEMGTLCFCSLRVVTGGSTAFLEEGK